MPNWSNTEVELPLPDEVPSSELGIPGEPEPMPFFTPDEETQINYDEEEEDDD